MIERQGDTGGFSIRRAAWCLAALTLSLSLAAGLLAQDTRKTVAKAGPAIVKPEARVGPALPASAAGMPEIVALSSNWERSYDLRANATVEIAVHLEKPSVLPANGRVGVSWTLADDAGPASPSGNNPYGLYTRPTANWRKTLHALDGDVYLVYRASKTGRYTLRLKPIVDETPVGDMGPRWRERGSAPRVAALPAHTPWPAGVVAPVAVTVHPIQVGDAREEASLHTVIECEPNDTPEQAQPIMLTGGDDIRTWEITGGADDVEFFDNGLTGRSGDDWFRLDYRGKDARLLTAQLGIPGQSVAAQLRCYRYVSRAASAGAAPKVLAPALNRPGSIDAATLLEEYVEGRGANERAHQQDESHRTNITRLLKPGESYLLRVEANAPGYQLQLRTVPPGPYSDPRMAVRQGMYQQIGQVDAWLTNRPRGASVERRIRDSGNLLGTQCMSCHTQSGVWGPAVPIASGYRLENTLSYWHMLDVMYECLRPTNVLKDAANNTSLAPLDLGDGPAGTRAAGFNIVNAERVRKPSRLHSKQQIRTANYVLQTSDPGGINAAGPGSNVGQAIVYLFAAEILKSAWEKSDDPKYFRALEDRARRILEVTPSYTDDVAVRIDFFGRVFPLKRYLAEAQRAGDRERALGLAVKTDPAAADAFITRAAAQLAGDEARIRAIQNEDGSWGFNPGKSIDGGKSWQRGEGASDPSPTALAITALTSAGRGKEDVVVAKGVKALLAMQEPAGRWNRAALTGFVSSAYALHALARLYPETSIPASRGNYVPKPGETLLGAIRRVQALAMTGDPNFADLMAGAARHSSPLVRYWAMIGLGGVHTSRGVPVLTAGLSDRVKMVRDAATWAFRETLLDDKGWSAAFAAFEKGNDDTRAQVVQALGMRADAVMPRSAVDWTRLAALFERAMNRDPHPAVRAWAARSAWQWWVWNPPIRGAINMAWLTMLTRPEPNALVENSNRYSSQALFIANGHKANGSREQQYKELGALFTAISSRMDAPGDEAMKSRLADRLIAIAGTFFQTAGADGGPGQMGYVTPGSAEMMGKAALAYLGQAAQSPDLATMRAGIEGASNVPFQPLTNYLVNYSLKGREELRQLAASAVSDPRSVSLAAVPELVEPQLAQVKRGAMEPPRRPQLSDPILDLWSKVNWTIPKTDEQRHAFFDLMIPRFDRYLSDSAVAAISDPAKRAEAARDMDANWYLADRTGDVLRSNPDLHQEIVLLSNFPTRIKNPLEERYWVQNVEWMLTLQAANARSGAVGQPDPLESAKDRALQLYLDELKPTADPKTRAIAIGMANQTALRSNPEVLRALEDALPLETNLERRVIIENALKQSAGRFVPELNAALKAEHDPSVPFDEAGNPVLTKAQRDDIDYFRDYVMPELNRQKRTDQQACMGCHGLAGRVPSLYLHAPDRYGYSSTADLVSNYRTLQKRVVLADIEKSKLLRKPLNVQDGKEDGHQGGRRYNPGDSGYLILRHWVENQPIVQAAAPAAEKSETPKSPQSGGPPPD